MSGNNWDRVRQESRLTQRKRTARKRREAQRLSERHMEAVQFLAQEPHTRARNAKTREFLVSLESQSPNLTANQRGYAIQIRQEMIRRGDWEAVTPKPKVRNPNLRGIATAPQPLAERRRQRQALLAE